MKTTDQELQKIADDCRQILSATYSNAKSTERLIFFALKRVRDAQEEKLRIARDLLMHVDNRAQQDFNGVNWYDAREEFIEKMGVK